LPGSSLAPVRDNRTLRRAVLAIVGVVAAVWAILVGLPPLLAPEVPGAAAADNLKAISDTRTAIVQLIAGAALLLGLYFTARTYRLTQRGQLTDRFSEAVTQLADASAVVRMGGIYALEQVANDWPEYAPTVADVLAAFVRERAIPGGKVEASVQAALTVLGGPSVSSVHRALDLSGANLQGASLQGAVLNQVDLSGADLTGAMLVDAHLVRSEMVGANLSDADLSAADLRDANLHRATLDQTDFYRAAVWGTRLRAVDIRTVKNFSSEQRAQAEIEP
jgi:hypothetical protein